MIEIRRAVAGDAAAIVALRDERAAWLLRLGIRQWQPGEVTGPIVEGWLTTGRVYVAEAEGRLVGSVRLAWTDEAVWGERPPDAGYVQALVSARSVAGRGVGAGLLRHVEGVVARSGRPLVRLSCLRGNAPLEEFYRSAGYAEVGWRAFEIPGWDPVTLFEQAVS